MLLKSNSSNAPTSLAASAAFARWSRYVRSRSGLTRSSQSTVWAPGEANGRVAIDAGVAASTALTEASSWLGDGGSAGTAIIRPIAGHFNHVYILTAGRSMVLQPVRSRAPSHSRPEPGRGRPMHFVGHVDWSFADDPLPPSDRSEGLARKVLVGPDQGAVHTELALGALHPGGWLQRHVHSHEEALYVLEGELLLEHDGRVHRLVPGDYALNALGMWHGLGNDRGVQARWLSVNTPQRLALDAGRKDTLYQR